MTVQFNGDRFDKIVSVLVSAQHEAWKSLDDLIPEIRKKVIGYVFAEYDMSDVEILVNPSGRFVIGGFEADTGLTGRKTHGRLLRRDRAQRRRGDERQRCKQSG